MQVQAVLFDLDGVMYEGERPIPGALESLRWVREQGIPHLFLTNTTSRPRAALVTKLRRFGIETRSDQILSPPTVACRWLAEHVPGKTALFVSEATREEFAGLPIASEESADVGAVVLGDLGRGWSFELLNHAFRLLMGDPPPVLVALGMTRYWRAEDGLRLDVAPFAAALACASGVEPVVLGKPALAFYRAALELLGVDAAHTVMLGDDIRSDIEGAQRAGMRAVMVRTGKFRPRDLERGITPDDVIDSIADFPRWWINNAK